jgi:hypothetical protein
MPAGGPPIPPVSPWTWEAGDYHGNTLSISAAFDDSAGQTAYTLVSCTITRQPGCVYRFIYIGLGADGTVESTPFKFGPVPVGVTTAFAAQMASFGFTSLNQILGTQITGGP